MVVVAKEFVEDAASSCRTPDDLRPGSGNLIGGSGELGVPIRG
jgi:hypothetical protein